MQASCAIEEGSGCRADALVFLLVVVTIARTLLTVTQSLIKIRIIRTGNTDRIIRNRSLSRTSKTGASLRIKRRIPRTGQTRKRSNIEVVRQVTLYTAFRGIEGMVPRALALHSCRVVHLAACAGRAAVRCCVVVLVVGADCAVLAVEVGVYGWAVLALSMDNVIDLLVRAGLALQISEVPVLRMLTLDADLTTPEHIGGLVADTLLQCIVIDPIIGTRLTDAGLLELAFRAHRAAPVHQDILQSLVDAFAGLISLDVDLICAAVDFHASFDQP